MYVDIESALRQCAERTERSLFEYFNEENNAPSLIKEAQRYSILGGGKRIRAFLVFELCRMFGGEERQATPFACALEMIHAYSLIHDDLPCMDDDEYRRGKLTNHKVYGEAVAVLAGDALLTKAFFAASSNKFVLPEEVLRAVSVLSLAAGDGGMVGGQILDICAEKKTVHDVEELESIHTLKTGALIRAAASLGCIAAGVYKDEQIMNDVDIYAKNIGHAFQIIDDILDVTGDKNSLGKNIGCDKEKNKLTYMSFYTVEKAEMLAQELTKEAIGAIEKYNGSEMLQELACYLLTRKK